MDLSKLLSGMGDVSNTVSKVEGIAETVINALTNHAAAVIPHAEALKADIAASADYTSALKENTAALTALTSQLTTFNELLAKAEK